MNNPLYDNLFGVHSKNYDPFLHLLDGKTITYRQFLATSRKIANTFVGMGLEPGDCVAIQVEKSPEMLNIYAACAQAGLVFLPLNPSYTVDELKYFIENNDSVEKFILTYEFDIIEDELINIFLKHYNSYNLYCSAIVKNKSYINIEIIKCN